MSSGRCIHCGKQGHYSMMCPKKPNTSLNSMMVNIDSGGRSRGLNRLINGKRKRFSFGKSTF